MSLPSCVRFADDQEASHLMHELAQDLTPAAFLLGNGVLPTIAIEDDGRFYDLVDATWQTTWTGISFHLFLDLRFLDLGLKYRFLLDLVKDDVAGWAEAFCDNGGAFYLTTTDMLPLGLTPLLQIKAETWTPGLFLVSRKMAPDKALLERFCELHEGLLGSVVIVGEGGKA
jgi:hypothetical protein